MSSESLGGIPDTADLMEIVPDVEAARREATVDARPPGVDAVLQEIEDTLGVVPGFLRALEHDREVLSAQWQLVKRFTLGETRIPAKYRDLIGLAVASAVHCRYCAVHHHGLARAHGATEEELNEAASLAQYTAGLGALTDGHLLSLDDAAEETACMAEHLTGSPG